MAVITISRQYGSGGDDIAAKVCQALGYIYFDKRMVLQVAADLGLSDSTVVDFSEDNYKMMSFVDRFVTPPGVVAQVNAWKKEISGANTRQVIDLDAAHSTDLVEKAIHAAHKRGNFVIVGRGGQAILWDKTDALHVRIEAPLDIRVQRLHVRENMNLGGAKDIALKRDRAAADYLLRFHDVDWADPMLYDLVINTGKLSENLAVDLIVSAVVHLSPAKAFS